MKTKIIQFSQKSLFPVMSTRLLGKQRKGQWMRTKTTDNLVLIILTKKMNRSPWMTVKIKMKIRRRKEMFPFLHFQRIGPWPILS